MAEAITGVCDAARALKGEEMVDPDDPHVIAERELLAAAAQIELAAKMLAEIKPRHQDLELNKDIKYAAYVMGPTGCRLLTDMPPRFLAASMRSSSLRRTRSPMRRAH